MADPTLSSKSTSRGSAPQTSFKADSDDVHLLDRLAVLYRYRRRRALRVRPDDGGDDDPGLHAIQLFQAQAQILIEDERATAVPGLQFDQTRRTTRIRSRTTRRSTRF